MVVLSCMKMERWISGEIWDLIRGFSPSLFLQIVTGFFPSLFSMMSYHTGFSVLTSFTLLNDRVLPSPV